MTNFILKTFGGKIARVGVKIPREILPAGVFIPGGWGKLPRGQDKPVHLYTGWEAMVTDDWYIKRKSEKMML